jgi:hypothetical protein
MTTATSLQRLAALDAALIRSLKRLAFPAPGDLFEEAFRPLAGNIVQDKVSQIAGERFSSSLRSGLRPLRNIIRNVNVQAGHRSPFLECDTSDYRTLTMDP